MTGQCCSACSYRWLEVLRCISRWELLQQISSGMPTDAVLFAGAVPAGERGVGKTGAALKDQIKRLSNVTGAAAGDAAAAGGECGVDDWMSAP